MTEKTIADEIAADLTPSDAPAAPATPETPASTPAEGPLRGPDGKFAAATPTASQPEPTPQAPQTEPTQPKHEAIPLPVYLDTRDKLKAAEKRLADFEARQQTQTQPVPSPFDDAAYTAWQQDQLARVATSSKFDTSELVARQTHGDEQVTSAMDWAMGKAQGSPQFAAEFLKQKHPIDWAVKQQKRDSVLTDLGDDPDAYVRRRAAELGLTSGAPPNTPQPIPAAVPQPAHPAQPRPSAPRSLASAPSAGGGQNTVPSGPLAAFDALPIR